MKSCFFVVAVGLFVGGVANAGPILDQVNNSEPNTYGGLYIQAFQSVGSSIGQTEGGNPGQQLAQTFTVGVTGSLTRVDLDLAKVSNLTTQPLLFDIRGTSSTGVPNAADTPVLGALSIPASSVPTTSPNFGYVSLNVSGSGISVTTGEVLALTLRTTDNTGYLWGISSGLGQGPNDTYPRGFGYYRQDQANNPWTGPNSHDFGFKTYVDTQQTPQPQAAAVPEPGPLTLLGIGVASIAGFACRRRRPLASKNLR